MFGEKHWGLLGRGDLIGDLDLWEHGCCWVFLTSCFFFGQLHSANIAGVVI